MSAPHILVVTVNPENTDGCVVPYLYDIECPGTTTGRCWAERDPNTCWLGQCDELHDAADWLLRDQGLKPGRHPVDFRWDECYGHLSLSLAGVVAS